MLNRFLSCSINKCDLELVTPGPQEKKEQESDVPMQNPEQTMRMNIQEITQNGNIMAIILRQNFSRSGVHFVTPNEFSQQLAYMQHPAGKVISPHVHRPVPREVIYTQEVLFIKRGKLRVDFYDNLRVYLESVILDAGDVILLASAGHGFEVLEEVEMYEVKQGPYVEEADKIRFDGIHSDQIHYHQERDIE
jgi:mannose-6-phosphate isomerase-like protein (cupin superfamily)